MNPLPPATSPGGHPLVMVIRDAISPALLAQEEGPPAYELKFLLPEERARQVQAWASRHLALDPHADLLGSGGYRVDNLYLDAPDLAIYHRTGPGRRRKWRLRRYPSSPLLFLERKTRSGDRVSKRRTAIPTGEGSILRAAASDEAWPGHWFHRRLLALGLQPACCISYDRVAHVGHDGHGPLRLTLDRNLRGARADGWDVAEVKGGTPLLPGQVVLELKYRAALPALFKQLLQEMRLHPGPVSKYRTGIRVCGLDV